MSDLNINIIPMGEYVLEKVQPDNIDHYKAIKKLRDYTAKKQAFDLKYQLDLMKQNKSVGNNYLITDVKHYLGFLYVSPLDNGERVLSIIINRRLRNKGLGTIIIDSISNYLLDYDYAAVLRMNINKDNEASIKMASKCGYVKESETEQTFCFKKVRNV